MKHINSNRVIGLIMGLVSLGYLWMAFRIPTFPMPRPIDSDWFPKAAGQRPAAAVHTVVPGKAGHPSQTRKGCAEGHPKAREQTSQLLITLLAIAGYAFGLEWLGFVLASSLFGIGLNHCYGYRRHLISVVATLSGGVVALPHHDPDGCLEVHLSLVVALTYRFNHHNENFAMDALHGVLTGFSIALEPMNLLYVFIGVFAGTIIGMLPGLGPISALALMIPMTFSMDPASALILMAGVYYGAIFGGSTSSILLNAPGVASTVATSFDGYPMARQGMAGKAMAIAAYSSFVGGTLSALALMLVAPCWRRWRSASAPPNISP
jgi:hypothetical protein